MAIPFGRIEPILPFTRTSSATASGKMVSTEFVAKFEGVADFLEAVGHPIRLLILAHRLDGEPG